MRQLPPLPAGLKAIEEAAGLEAAVALAMERGGTRFNVPMSSPGTELEKIVGPDAAAKISRELGGQRIYMPMCKPLLANRLRWDEGKSVAEVALILKSSVTSVTNWTADRGEDAAQTTLAL